MTSYFLRRLVLLIPTFFGITVVTFAIMHLAPGSPGAMGGVEEGLPTYELMELHREYGLDRPLTTQYLSWVSRVVRLDFGRSLTTLAPVWDVVAERLPVTLALNGISLTLIYVITIPLGLITAARQDSWLDHGAAALVLLLYSFPLVWAAILLLLVFSVQLDWLPLSGIVSTQYDGMPFWSSVPDRLRHLLLPVLCQTYGGLAFMSRYTRSVTLEVIRQDYIRTARAKGLGERRVILRHTLRNALIPIVTLLGTLLPALLTGSVIVEEIFSLPGLGSLFFESVLRRDYTVALALSSVTALATLASLLLMDLVYVWVDPRLHFEDRRS